MYFTILLNPCIISTMTVVVFIHNNNVPRDFRIVTHITVTTVEFNIYRDSSVTVHLHKDSEKVRIKRGVRQGDTVSPKLFTATLESIFRMLNWGNKGVKIDGEFLSNLRLLMTYSYAQKHHRNYNRCYKNYPMKVDGWVLR